MCETPYYEMCHLARSKSHDQHVKERSLSENMPLRYADRKSVLEFALFLMRRSLLSGAGAII